MPIIKDSKTGNMVQVDGRTHYESSKYGDVMVVEGTRTPKGGRGYIPKKRERQEIVMRTSEDGTLLADRKNPGNERFNPATYNWKQSKRYENEEFKDDKQESPLELIIQEKTTTIPKPPTNQNYIPPKQPDTDIKYQVA